MNRSRLMLGAILLFLVGLSVVFGSVAWGNNAANAYLRAQGGGMDSARFMVVLQEYIAVYKWVGGILSLLGGLLLVKVIEVR